MLSGNYPTEFLMQNTGVTTASSINRMNEPEIQQNYMVRHMFLGQLWEDSFLSRIGCHQHSGPLPWNGLTLGFPGSVPFCSASSFQLRWWWSHLWIWSMMELKMSMFQDYCAPIVFLYGLPWIDHPPFCPNGREMSMTLCNALQTDLDRSCFYIRTGFSSRHHTKFGSKYAM